MKILTQVAILFFCLGFTSILHGQLTIPKTSPEVITQHDFAFTTVKIHYHSPSVMGRKIWGHLVPYNDGQPIPWRAGANNTTMISFSENVTIESQPLPAGKYGLHMVPAEGEWTIIFSKKWEGWGSYDYDVTQDALRIQVVPETSDFMENLTYSFYDRQADGITLALEWGTLRIPFRIAIDLNEQVFQRMEIQLAKLQGDQLRDAYGTAAYYCLANNVELERGLRWADRGLKYGKTYLLYNYKTDLLEKLGRKQEAAQARILGYKTLTPEKLFDRALNNLENGDEEGAGQKFSYLLSTVPKAWYGYESKAHLLNFEGKGKDARLWLTQALENAPPEEKERINGLLEEWRGN